MCVCALKLRATTSSPRVPGRRAAAAAAILRAEDFQRRALDEAVARNGDDHLPGLDQAFIVLVGGASAMAVRRGEAISSRTRASSSRMTSMRRGRLAMMSRRSVILAATSLQVRRRSSRARGRSGAAGASSRMPRAWVSVKIDSIIDDQSCLRSSISASRGSHVAGRPGARHQRRTRGRLHPGSRG